MKRRASADSFHPVYPFGLARRRLLLPAFLSPNTALNVDEHGLTLNVGAGLRVNQGALETEHQPFSSAQPPLSADAQGNLSLAIHPSLTLRANSLAVNEGPGFTSDAGPLAVAAKAPIHVTAADGVTLRHDASLRVDPIGTLGVSLHPRGPIFLNNGLLSINHDTLLATASTGALTLAPIKGTRRNTAGTLEIATQAPLYLTDQGVTLRLDPTTMQLTNGALAVKPAGPPLQAHAPLSLSNGSLNIALAPGGALNSHNDALTLALGDGLTQDAGRLALRLGPGLRLDSQSLTLSVAPGLRLDSQGLALPLAPGLHFNAQGLAPRLGAGLRLNGQHIALNPGPGLQVAANGAATVRAAPPLTVTDNGLALNVEAPLAVNNNRLKVILGVGLHSPHGRVASKVYGVLSVNESGVYLRFDGGLHNANGRLEVNRGNSLDVHNNILDVRPVGPLAIQANGLALTLDPAGALSAGAAGLAVRSGAGLHVQNGRLNAKAQQPLSVVDPHGITLQVDPQGPLDATGAHLALRTGPGITVVGGNLQARPRAPLTLDADSLSLNVGPGLAERDGALTLNLGHGLTLETGGQLSATATLPPCWWTGLDTQNNVTVGTRKMSLDLMLGYAGGVVAAAARFKMREPPPVGINSRVEVNFDPNGLCRSMFLSTGGVVVNGAPDRNVGSRLLMPNSHLYPRNGNINGQKVIIDDRDQEGNVRQHFLVTFNWPTVGLGYAITFEWKQKVATRPYETQNMFFNYMGEVGDSAAWSRVVP